MRQLAFRWSWNLSPWGDGNSVCNLCGSSRISWNLSPRGDGNPQSPLRHLYCNTVEIYPREGTETMFVDDTDIHPLGWNLSPWGDGNHDASSHVSRKKVEIYPREGTETSKYHLQHAHSHVEIYPREGTETTMRLMLPRSKPLKFIPVRGRKLFFEAAKASDIPDVEIYPREGAETAPSTGHPDDQARWNLSPWGDGNSFRISAYFFIIVEIYPREGTETARRISNYQSCHVEIYPREGTETPNPSDVQPSKLVEIYPREGTETMLIAEHPRITLQLKFIPVRGRKLIELSFRVLVERWNLSP